MVRIQQIHSFSFQEMEPGYLSAGKNHSGAELIYVDQGSLHCVVDGRDIPLNHGQLLVCGADQWHMHYADLDVSPRILRVSFDLTAGTLDTLRDRSFAASGQLLAILEQMLLEWQTMDDYSWDIIGAQLSMLLLLLLRQAGGVEAGCVRNNENEIIRKTQQYTAAHIREKLSVPVVARQVGVSPSYLTALFHKHLHISPGEFIRRVKLQESKNMIRQRELNFTEIADALHYSTVHHFSRQFKEKYGITPTEYAKSVDR